MRSPDENIGGPLSCWMLGAIIVAGLLVLAVRLRVVQVDEAASYGYAHERQSERRVLVGGRRGEIVDRNGVIFAANRPSVSVVCRPAEFRSRKSSTADRIWEELKQVERVIGRPSHVSRDAVARHVKDAPAMDLSVWRELSEDEAARFAEHESELPGFALSEVDVRVYPQGRLASHVIGYVGRDRGYVEAGDKAFRYFLPELRGRSGLELFYDSYLRGVPGETDILVDAGNYAVREWNVVAPQPGPELRLSLDAELQRTVEGLLHGQRGACAVIDPRTGGVLALASAPDFDPNDFVPTLSPDVYQRYRDDPAKPLLNRAVGGAYAPGSTFKPVTALAALEHGISQDETYSCSGAYECGEMMLRCARRWGHGELDMRHAMMMSCNPYYCNLGLKIGTNAITSAAHALGLGEKTGIDLGVDMSGVVPDASWKVRSYHEKWYVGDLVQMSIGQGMLLVTPLQMARVAGAIGTGFMVTPHLKGDIAPDRRPLPFSREHLDVVRSGMKMTVNGDPESEDSAFAVGTGHNGGENVSYADGTPVVVAGKTGTAEVGLGAKRRNNAWFVAYAPAEYPSIAVAMVVENGASGGGTTAPLVACVLRDYFSRRRK